MLCSSPTRDHQVFNHASCQGKILTVLKASWRSMIRGSHGLGTNQEDKPELILITNSGDSEQRASQFCAC